MDLLTALNTRINKIVGVMLTAAFTVMVVVIFLQVVFRYWLQHSLSWSEELARYLFVWATFLGASAAFYDNSHISVTYFTNLCANLRLRAAVLAIADLCCIVFLAVYVYDGFLVASRVYKLGQFSPSMEWLPIGLVFLAIPIGSVCMFLNVLANLICHGRTVMTGEVVTLPHQNKQP